MKKENNDMAIADKYGFSNKEWAKLENAELVGSLENGNVVGKFQGTLYECVPDKRENDFLWCFVPLNR